MSTAWILVVAVAYCTGASNATPRPVNYLNCSGEPYPPAKDGITVAVGVDPCDSVPCQAKKGQNATTYVTFTPTVAVESVTAVAHGKLGILPVIPYPIPFTDGCKNSNLTCPLVAGQTYHYLTVVPVPEDAPTTKVTVYFQLKNEKKEDIVCILFQLQIV